MDDLNDEIMDVTFVKAVDFYNYPGGYQGYVTDHRFDEGVFLGDHWRHKYLLDLDGMSYSGRFLLSWSRTVPSSNLLSIGNSTLIGCNRGTSVPFYKMPRFPYAHQVTLYTPIQLIPGDLQRPRILLWSHGGHVASRKLVDLAT